MKSALCLDEHPHFKHLQRVRSSSSYERRFRSMLWVTAIHLRTSAILQAQCSGESRTGHRTLAGSEICKAQHFELIAGSSVAHLSI